MIEASFDRNSQQAAVSGVYQYDTGQRLRFSGLPSPYEMGEADDFLSGDLAAVQAHFSYESDEQTTMRLVQWDEDRYCWMVNIPDEYLTRVEPVHVYVYVSHGSSEDETRGKTRYEGVFTPISRPAPDNVVSEDQLDRWEALEAEVVLALSSSQTAAQNALDKVDNANEAAEEAAQAAKNAQEATAEVISALDNLKAVDEMWSATQATRYTGNEAGAVLADQIIVLTLPEGEKGPVGDPGDTGPSDISLSLENGILTITPIGGD